MPEKDGSFLIPDANLSRLTAAFEKLGKRAKRIGVVPPTLDVHSDPVDVEVWFDRQSGSRVRTPDPDDIAELRVYRKVKRSWKVRVQGETPKYAGWRFIATLQHLKDDEGEIATILRALDTSFSIPERYRTAAPDCDHCGVRRYRRDTYLVVHDDGRLKQVGSTCIKDFLGHASPEWLAASAELLAEALGYAGDYGDDEEGMGSGKMLPHTFDFLACVSAIIRDSGFMSRKRANEIGCTATADFALSMLEYPPPKNAPKVEESDRVRAREAIEWAREVEAGESDYLHNLRVIAKCSALAPRTDGIAASMIAAYERAKANEIERQHAINSTHVGEIGKRQVFGPVTILQAKEINTMYGRSILFVFADEQGNRLKTFSGANEKLGEIGAVVYIKGTPKKHDCYQGIKQTMLGRVAVCEAPKPKMSRRKKKEAEP